MATTARQHPQKGEFTIDVREHGYPEGPAHVLVEVSPLDQETFMVIMAAGVDGRFSFDVSIGESGIEIEKAYIEGMRAGVDALPAWVAPIRERVETALEVAAS